MPGHDNIVWIFHAVQGSLAVHWKSVGNSIRLSGRDTPLDSLTVISDHDRRSLYGGYDSLLVSENEPNTRRLVNE
jgi:hypothetical protein